MMGISSISRVNGWLSALVVAAVLWSPTFARACSVCSTGREDESSIAYIFGTAFMTLMPFALVGSLLLWLRGFVRESEAAHETARKLGTEAAAIDETRGIVSERHAQPQNANEILGAQVRQ